MLTAPSAVTSPIRISVAPRNRLLFELKLLASSWGFILNPTNRRLVEL